MLQRLLTVLVYQLNDDEAADDDNFGEEDHVSSFRQAIFALPCQHELCLQALCGRASLHKFGLRQVSPPLRVARALLQCQAACLVGSALRTTRQT